jgi:putative ABC transport system permease protein
VDWSEALGFSIMALRANPVRSMLTGLGMVIGTASVILVVAISLTSEEYILNQIQAVGSNVIFASLEVGSVQANKEVDADFIKVADVQAIRDILKGRIVAATGVDNNFDRISFNGRPQRLLVIGSDEYYQSVRNLKVLTGRFLDASDVTERQHVAVLTEKLARRLFGSQSAAVGQTLDIYGLRFVVIGTFREKVNSFGQSELNDESVVIPISVQRMFSTREKIDPLYVQARTPEDVVPVTALVQNILEGRHRPGAKYKVENLVGILSAAKAVALALRVVLILISAIALAISGVGIMNIMLVTVTERTREIGLRMAVGASRREILAQFLIEAVLIAVAGGTVGIIAGVAIPLGVQLLMTNVHIPISITSIVLAFTVSCCVGLIFGVLPANRASKLNPTEALRHE